MNNPSSNNPNRTALLKGLGAVVLVILVFSLLSRIIRSNGETLTQYAQNNPSTEASDLDDTPATDETLSEALSDPTEPFSDESAQTDSETVSDESLGTSDAAKPDFYFEPLTSELIDYITGVSFPAEGAEEIAYEDLVFLHVLHMDFYGESAEGELICNKAIAQDLLEIFEALYEAEYQIEKIQLIEVYDGDDELSMADNNTSCFNYRNIDGTSRLSRHSLGLAVDINPFYNPYIRYTEEGGQLISPVGSEIYADRSQSFPYKIDTDDLCYRLFIEHGFTWGGNWNSSKDYQHFQKNID